MSIVPELLDAYYEQNNTLAIVLFFVLAYSLYLSTQVAPLDPSLSRWCGS